MILFSDTVQEQCDVQHDAATEAQGGRNFKFVGAADAAAKAQGESQFLSAACGDANGCSAETAMQRLCVNLA